MTNFSKYNLELIRINSLYTGMSSALYLVQRFKLVCRAIHGCLQLTLAPISIRLGGRSPALVGVVASCCGGDLPVASAPAGQPLPVIKSSAAMPGASGARAWGRAAAYSQLALESRTRPPKLATPTRGVEVAACRASMAARLLLGPRCRARASRIRRSRSSIRRLRSRIRWSRSRIRRLLSRIRRSRSEDQRSANECRRPVRRSHSPRCSSLSGLRHQMDAAAASNYCAQGSAVGGRETATALLAS